MKPPPLPARNRSSMISLPNMSSSNTIIEDNSEIEDSKIEDKKVRLEKLIQKIETISEQVSNIYSLISYSTAEYQK